MIGVVMASSFGLSRMRVPALERFGHALAGLTIVMSGSLIAFLGL
jgi:hypothetical protein